MECKFFPGTWIVPKDSAKEKMILYISSVGDVFHYNVEDINGTVRTIPRLEIDTKWREWNIETDVENGDILQEDSCIFIVEKYGKNFTKVHCCFFNDGEFNNGCMLSFEKSSTHPARNGERLVLFQKIAESGCTWHPVEKQLVNKDDYCPAFENGTWIMHNGRTFCKESETPLRVYVRLDGMYQIETEAGDFDQKDFWYIDSNYRLWNISDAKDGDFVTSENNIYIIKRDGEIKDTVSAYCGVSRLGRFCNTEINGIDAKNPFSPASSKERNLLLESMSKEGWKWNAEEKTVLPPDKEILVNTEDSPVEPFRKDANMLDDLCEKLAMEILERQELLNWLKSVREKVLWKPTGEQLKVLEGYATNAAYPDGTALNELLKDLKKFV